ncbi:inositol monophosphatase [Magnetospirillum sp. J10]|uniref:Inositol monophosphatase n=1 Tax=Magnetospirillum sulfuroxidans TaxID=611300 RepID=A0ABS5I8S5_9PROT|nr:inositol monophosphatase [Magnetospirillum sulfuroxidans]
MDVSRVAGLIREAAEAEILPRFKKLSRDQIREKKPNQLVTDADVMAERLLTRTLTDLLPGAVVGEEAVDANPALLDALHHPGIVWVIDPVDGTGNFANNNPRFAVIVALVVDGVTIAGWIHDPVPNRTVIAEIGQGAWRDGTRLKVAAEVPLPQMTGSVKKRGRVADQVLHVARRGSAAHDYLDLVTGRQHFAHFRKLMPWDHAAGVLMQQEAGGVAAMIDGTPYVPVLHADGQLLLTPGQHSWDQLAPLVD